MQDETFEHVVSRTAEILSQNLFASSERHISEVLTHIDLLERTVRFCKSVGEHSYRRNPPDEADVKQLNDLRVVFSELLEKFL